MVSGKETVTAGGAQTPAIPLRLRFRKTGNMQYISHLDLLRTMEHATMRAALPMRFSAGFNPHAKITFALPLSVGAESLTECMDVQLERPVDYTWAIKAMNKQLPEDLAVFAASAGVYKVGQIGFAEYEIRLFYDGASAGDAAQLEALYKAPLIVTKRTKSGEKETDIAPMIARADCTYEDGAVVIRARLSAGGERGILNPEYLLRAAERYLSLPLGDPERAECRILRRELYLTDNCTVFA